ncbi:MAG: DUF1989 domain-containing protein [Solirubrobacterales bacterium]
MPGKVKRVAPGKATTVELEAGDELAVVAPEGGQGGDLSFLGFDQALSRNINGWERYGRPWQVLWVEEGMRLFDGGGEAVLRVGPSRGPGHIDISYAGCWSEIYPDRRPGCRELISEQLGIGRSEITGMLSFFLQGTVEDGVYRGFEEEAIVKPGDFVSFEALRDVTVALSACPDDTIPGWRPAPLEVEVRR